MDSERLAECRAYLDHPRSYSNPGPYGLVVANDLLAEVDRLTAENAELRDRLTRCTEGRPVQHRDPEGPTP